MLVSEDGEAGESLKSTYTTLTVEQLSELRFSRRTLAQGQNRIS
jgi:hypothetical protein